MSIEKTAEILKFEDNIVHVHLLMNVKKMRKNAAEKVHTTSVELPYRQLIRS